MWDFTKEYFVLQNVHDTIFDDGIKYSTLTMEKFKSNFDTQCVPKLWKCIILEQAIDPKTNEDSNLAPPITSATIIATTMPNGIAL